jgi:DNA helicase-4
MAHTIYRNFLGRWFGKVTKVVISDAGLTLVDLSKKNKEISIVDLVDFPTIEQTVFGKTLVIKTKLISNNGTLNKAQSKVFRIWGIDSVSAKVFDHEAEIDLNKNIAKNITSHLELFHKEAISQYLRDSSVDGLNGSVNPFLHSYRASKGRWKNLLSTEQLSKIDVISRMPVITDVESYRQYYENKQLDAQSAYFDGIETNPLTQEQRLAVIRNNDKNLILAAAGTGKTSVMVAKALYLIAYDNVPAENVLVLAYNNAAAKELKERLEARKKAFGLSCQSPTILTFHALGLKILNKVKANTNLSAFAKDLMQLESWLSKWLVDHISHSTTAMKRFIELAYQSSGTFECNSQQEYKGQVRSLLSQKPEDIITALTASGLLAKSIKKFMKCLQVIRVEKLNAEQIESRLRRGKINNSNQYAALLDDIVKAYTAELRGKVEIDFDDMIVNAFNHVNDGTFTPQWSDILVDEFQDISAARMNLINELISKGPRPRLTVVGDDWQSIYRFSGGKLALITQFEKFSGSHSLTTLQKTFRYNNSIAETAGQFVMQNPEQYSKYIEAHHQVKESQVYLVDSDKNNLDKRITQVVKNIKANDPMGTIAILARYRYLLNNAKAELSCLSDISNINYWTFHGSKGLEADYSIIIGLCCGKAGFPSDNQEEAIVDALLPCVDGFKHSEERRLLYVAMTRAKKKVYLIADPMAPSEFIEELLSPSYDLQIMSEKFGGRFRKTFKCSSCHNGYFSLSSGKYGDFYQCSSQTICDVKPRICIKCNSPSIDCENASVCQNPDCQESLKLCAKCNRAMKLITGQYGDFWGCSGYVSKSEQCLHKERVG